MAKPLLCKRPFTSIAIKSFNPQGKLSALWPCCMMGNTTLRETANNSYTLNKLKIKEDISDLTPEELFNHPRMELLRNRLKNGVRDPACEICWEQEDRGITSFRQLSFSPGDNPAEIINNSKLEMIDISLNNVCNLRCRMCSPHASNQLMIDQDYFKKNNLVEQAKFALVRWSDSSSEYSFNIENITQWDWIVNNTDKIKSLRLSGGEPFYSNKVISFLDTCISNGSSDDLEIEFHTNATLFTDSLMQKLVRFKNNLNFSIDGCDKVYEYIRYPATWNQLTTSIEKYLEYVSINVLNITVVVMITNLFNLPDFFRWVSEIAGNRRICINYAEVYTADRGVALRHLSIELLTEAAALIKSASLETGVMCSTVLTIITDAITNNKEDKKKVLAELELFDMSRGQYYGDYLDVKVVNWLKS